MPIDLYAATVPAWRQQLSAVSRLIDKAADWCAANECSPQEMIEARLIADMLPFGYQVKSCVGHSLGALEGARAGEYHPDRGGWPQDFAGLKAKLDGADAALADVDPAEINGFVGRDMAFVMGEMRMDFATEEFLLSFSLPNFYFHATTAYALLRARGVPLGKRDFLGQPRLRS